MQIHYILPNYLGQALACCFVFQPWLLYAVAEGELAMCLETGYSLLEVRCLLSAVAAGHATWRRSEPSST